MSCKFKIIQKESIQIESLKYFIEHAIVIEIFNINIPEEDVEPKKIILDLDDQPVWKSAKTVAPTPTSTIIQLDVDDNFVANTIHLNLIRKNKFNGYLPADPHDHICEFLAICDMFKYGKTQSEVVKLMIFPLSLSDEAKMWFNELNEESITSWEQMKSQNICESLTEAWLRLKSMLQKCHGHETMIKPSVFYLTKSQTVSQEPQSKTDLEKLMTKFLDNQRVSNMFVINNVNDMIIKMKQNEKNFQTKIKNMERKIDEWSKSQNVSLKQTDRTEPPPPPQAHTEHVNAVFTESGKYDDSLKIQTPPPIIVNNKRKKDKPVKTGYHVVKINEYPF
nr:hypothetical protein [Tanacetum cinerariifolium]